MINKSENISMMLHKVNIISYHLASKGYEQNKYIYYINIIINT